MDRRRLIASGLVTLGAVSLGKSALAQTVGSQPLPPAQPRSSEPAPYRPPYQPPAEAPPTPTSQPTYGTGRAETYSQDEMVNSISDFMGVTAESAGAAVERIFSKNGRPTAYIAGEEGSGAFVVGARYGRGLMYMKGREPVEVYWQGPSAGWDFGANASRVFTLCYELQDANEIFQRFPGVEGSAYLIGGLGVNYQRANGITLAPIRAGVGLRLGANVGYLGYSRKRNVWPF